MIKSLNSHIISNETVEIITPVPRTQWEAVFAQDRYATITQSPAWTEAVCKQEGYRDASRLYLLPDGRQLLLPLVRQARPSFMRSGGSMPTHWGYGGLLSSTPINAEDVRLVWQDLTRLGWQHIRIRPNPLLADVWANGRLPNVHMRAKRAHVLHLNDDFETVWKKQFSSTMRRNVRKATKMGVTVECNTDGKLVPIFYDLFQRSVERWAGQQHEPPWLAKWRSQRRDPISKFEALTAVLGDSGKMYVAWHNGEAAAAILILQGHNAHYTRGVMNREIANKTRANDLLHSVAIEAACEAGCHTYHMGETGNSASLAQFKEKFGAKAYPYAEYYLERVPLTAVDQKLRQFIKKSIGFKD